METVTAFTTADRLQATVSRLGVDLRTDDSAADVELCISDATNDVRLYTSRHYELAELTNSAWVEKAARILAVYELCFRRLNAIPEVVEKRRQEVMSQLEAVSKGRLHIPDARRRKAPVPVVSNVRIMARPGNHTVVQQERSTGTPEGYVQDRDPFELRLN